jgi:ketosteroid isomerase-like protein
VTAPISEVDAAEIRAVVAAINDAWLKAPPAAMRAEMARYFHADIVVRGPDFTRLSVGRDACIDSYAEFVGGATVLDAEFAEADVDVFGDAAIASTHWRLKYEMGGARYDETGHDVFAFMRAGGRWLAVWRLLLTSGG